MATEAPAAREDLPDEVLTFGGNGGQHYHRIDDEGEPACKQHGRNPMRKDRKLIESHYDPCPRGACFPGAAGETNE